MNRQDRRKEKAKAEKEKIKRSTLPPQTPTPDISKRVGAKQRVKRWWDLKVDFWYRIGAGIVGLVIAGITIYQGCFKKKYDTGVINSPRISDNTVTIESTETKQPREYSDRFYYNKSEYKLPPVNGIYIKGLSEMESLIFKYGSNNFAIPVSSLNEGIDFFKLRYFYVADCSDMRLEFVAKEDRLFVSCEFRELKGGGLIGDMDLNRWKVYDDKYLEYCYDDKSFEVRDQHGYVVCNVSFLGGDKNPFVSIAGYFWSPNAVVIMNREKQPRCIKITPNSNWEQEAENEIYQIKPGLKSNCN